MLKMQVRTSSLLEECAPALPLSQVHFKNIVSYPVSMAEALSAFLKNLQWNCIIPYEDYIQPFLRDGSIPKFLLNL